MATTLAINGNTDVERIKEQFEQAKNDKKLTRLAFFLLKLDKVVVSAAMDLLQHDRSRRWEVLEFERCSGFEPLLKIAIPLDLFRQVHINTGSFIVNSLDIVALQYLCSAMQKNHQLEEIAFSCILFPNHQAVTLGKALKCATNLRILRLHDCTMGSLAVTALADGLARNKTLHTLKVHCSGKSKPPRLLDSEVASLVRGLLSHPSLQTLDLSGNCCEQQGLQAIAGLLASSKTLEYLYLQNQDGGLRCGVETIMEGLRGNQHLKTLCFNRNKLGDEDLASLGRILWTCPALEALDMYDNKITDRGLALFALQPNRSKLRRLELTWNDFTNDAAPWLLRILEIHSELGLVGSFWGNFDQSKEIEYHLNLNRSGRFLLQQNVTLALWPLVFAKVNTRYFGECSASILFHLLQGPALIERRH